MSSLLVFWMSTNNIALIRLIMQIMFHLPEQYALLTILASLNEMAILCPMVFWYREILASMDGYEFFDPSFPP